MSHDTVIIEDSNDSTEIDRIVRRNFVEETRRSSPDSSNSNNSNIFKSGCCNSRGFVDRRLLGFTAQVVFSLIILVFSMRQIMVAEKGTDLSVYYTMIGSILGSFTPSYFDKQMQTKKSND